MKYQLSSILLLSLLHSTFAGSLRRTESDDQNNRDLYDGPQTRIVGGEQSEIGEFPYYVDMGGCGGSLIAPGVVLSAAHCGSFDGTRVSVGGYEWDELTGGATIVRVVDEARHPNYNAATVENDFLLLRLEEPVEMNTDVVLSINDQFSRPFIGQSLTVLGLGITSEGGPSPDFLRDVVVQAISSDVCNSANRYDDEVRDSTMFCAGVNGGGKDSCQGDSGGPIVIRNGNQHIQVGVVSWGYGCAQPNFPGVYSRVSSAEGWIKNVVCDSWQMSASFCGPQQPTPPPTGGPPPTPPPTPPPFTCSGGALAFDFTLNTDNWGEETSWEVTDAEGNEILSDGGYTDDESYNTKQCISNGCYKMTISDSYGDGLSEGGTDPGYTLIVDGGVEEQARGDNFGYEVDFQFGNCNGSTPPPTPPPTNPPTNPPTPPPTNPQTPPSTPPPTNPPTPPPTPPPTDSPNTSCSAGEMDFDFLLNTDDWGSETSWAMTDVEGKEILSGGGFADDESYNTRQCIKIGCYRLTVSDTYGDGLSEGGTNPGYRLVIDGSVKEQAGGDNFGFQKSFQFGDCSVSGSCTPFMLRLKTDEWGYESSFTLIKDGNVIWDKSGFDNNDEYEFTECLDASECNELTVYDDYGDGILNPGEIAVILDGEVKYQSGDIGDGVSFQYGNC